MCVDVSFVSMCIWKLFIFVNVKGSFRKLCQRAVTHTKLKL